MAMNYEQYRDSVFRTLWNKASSPEEGRALVEVELTRFSG